MASSNTDDDTNISRDWLIASTLSEASGEC